MAKIAKAESRAARLIALHRRSQAWLCDSLNVNGTNSTNKRDALQRTCSVFSRWAESGCNGASLGFIAQQLRHPMAPTVCGKLDGFSYVYAILSRAHKRGIYIGWTSQSLAARLRLYI
jgi:hypothetical protein